MKSYEKGLTVHRLYPRRLESLTIVTCNYKDSTFYSVTRLLRQDPESLSGQRLNPRPPARLSEIQPTELTGRRSVLYTREGVNKQH